MPISPFVRRFGSSGGRPIVALHGGGLNGEHWRRLAELHLPERQWICPDLPGHGRTLPGDPDTCTIDRMAADIRSAVPEGGPFDLVGHSLGGMVAIAVVRAHPDRVRSVVLLDPPVMTAAQYRARRAARAPVLERGDEGWPTFADFVSYIRSDNPGVDERMILELRDEVTSLIEERRDGRLHLISRPEIRPAFQADLTASTFTFGTGPVLGDFDGRALLVVAGRSSLSDTVTREGLAEFSTQVGERLSVIGIDGGHHLLWDSFDETAGVIADFLTSETGRRLTVPIKGGDL